MGNTLNLDKCPNCGGVIILNKDTGNLSCKYCGKLYTYEELKSDYTASEDCNYDEYICPDCGASIVTDSLNIVHCCAYCGNTSVIKNRISGKYRPDFILPFRVTENVAKETLERTVKGKNCVKKSFRKNLQIKDISSLFVPFWLYDCAVSGSGKYVPLSDEKTTKQITFTERYEKVPVDASLRLDDNYMDVLEPFHYSELKSFDRIYLVGHLAERYDTDVKLMSRRAKVKLEKAAKTSLGKRLLEEDDTIEGHVMTAMTSITQNVVHKVAGEVTNRIDHGTFQGNVNVQYEGDDWKDDVYIHHMKKFKADIRTEQYYYALFPVYLIRCEYRGKNYLFAVNGQTGKLAGKFEFSMANYIMQNFVGGAIGSILFATIMFLALYRPLQAWLDIPMALVYLILFAVSFLFISILEISHNGGLSLDWMKEYLGQRPTVANAKYYRVKGSFRNCDK